MFDGRGLGLQLHSVQTGPGAEPVSYPVDTVKLISQLQLVPGLIHIPPLPHTSSWRGANLTFFSLLRRSVGGVGTLLSSTDVLGNPSSAR
jgi:hypothetical protein